MLYKNPPFKNTTLSNHPRLVPTTASEQKNSRIVPFERARSKPRINSSRRKRGECSREKEGKRENWPGYLSGRRGSRGETSRGFDIFSSPVVVTATLAFPSGIGRLCSGRYRARGKKRHSIHTSRHSASSYASFVPSFALFRVVSPLFSTPPSPIASGWKPRGEDIPFSLLPSSTLPLFPPRSLSLSRLETLLSNPRFSARVFPSLRERTRVWLITWSSDICADRKLRTSPWRVSREREREKFSPLFDPYHPFHLTLGVTMCFSNLASSHERLNEFREAWKYEGGLF